MASVDKMKIGTTTYDVAPSGAGTLSGFTSKDASSATSWTAADVIAIADTQDSIFQKLTTMIKNVRFIYSKLGTTDFSATGATTITGAIAALQSSKASSTHSHDTSKLPVSSNHVNSDEYVPTSALVYSLNDAINSMAATFTMGENLTTNIPCGGLASGTAITSGMTLASIVKKMLYTS